VRWRSWVHLAVDTQGMDGDSGVAWIPGVSARSGRTGEDTETVGAAQACSRRVFMQRMRSPPAPCARCAGAGDSRPAMERIPGDRGGRGASLAVPGMRRSGGEDRATAVQGTVQ